MSEDIALSVLQRRDNPQDFDDYKHQGMLETIVSSPGHIDHLPANPPPGPKWHARTGLYRLGLNGAAHDVMGCLIDHASKATGRCFPTEQRIAEWTNRPKRTVERAIAELRKRNLIAVVEIGCKTGKRNRYYINWTPLFAAYEAIKSFQRRKPPKVAAP